VIEPTPVPPATLAARAARLRSDLPPATAVLAASHAGIRWLTGIVGAGHYLYGNTPAVAIVGPDGPVRLVVAAADLGWVADEVDLDAVVPYGWFSYAGRHGGRIPGATTGRMLEEAVAIALRATGASAVVADDGLPWTRAAAIEAACGVTLQPGHELLRRARAVKDAREIELLRAANVAAEDALFDAVGKVRTGITELELLTLIQQGMLERDARPLLGAVGFTERGALVDAWPSDRALRPGDTIRFDIGCSYLGYHADMSRTAAFGRVPQTSRDAYAAILAGEDACLAATRAGAPAATVFNAGVDATRAAGIGDYARSHCGHGIGLEIYEPPLIADSSDTVLEAGMTLCLETPLYRLDDVGLQVEDAVVVTADGCDRLGRSPRAMIDIDA